MRDWIVGDIEGAEFGIGVEAGYLRQGVVGDVEFFQVGKGGKTGDGGKAVGLYG